MIEDEAARQRVARLASRRCESLERRCAAYRVRHTAAHLVAAAMTVAVLSLIPFKVVARPTCIGMAGNMQLETITTIIDSTLSRS